MINGVLAMMDPVGAFFTVVFLELLVRLRMIWLKNKQASIILQIIDSSRIGLLYGLFMEGFKLL
ncbi:secreted or membrane protein [Prochlorococcus sp. MIT 0601]|nr:secreted or membrane protein [Prochlorococcus sp. MIT 0601]